MNLENVADLRFAWEHKVMPLLQEYFYGDGETLSSVLGSDFIAKETINLGSADSADERTVYQLKPLEADGDFINALESLAGGTAG